jgi:AraC-like DNA-binding protein
MQMKSQIIAPPESLSVFIKTIFLLENEIQDKKTSLPFFADGYPGIVYQLAPEGLYLNPPNKKLSPLFLYGQTIHPIELTVEGVYRMIVFQLYPFASNMLFGINPKELNDTCYDLARLTHLAVEPLLLQLTNTHSVSDQVNILSAFLQTIIEPHHLKEDNRIPLAIHLILNSKGLISVKELREKLYIAERTFERQFTTQIGVSPKQFSRIIQFNRTLNQLTEKHNDRLTDIAFNNGFADQSHFIRTFKKYTGNTPLEFLSKK